ncbi:MAG: hypothetical protein U1F68_05510 [Gammaproteobacteria bacterium]
MDIEKVMFHILLLIVAFLIILATSYIFFISGIRAYLFILISFILALPPCFNAFLKLPDNVIRTLELLGVCAFGWGIARLHSFDKAAVSEFNSSKLINVLMGYPVDRESFPTALSSLSKNGIPLLPFGLTALALGIVIYFFWPLFEWTAQFMAIIGVEFLLAYVLYSRSTHVYKRRMD